MPSILYPYDIEGNLLKNLYICNVAVLILSDILGTPLKKIIITSYKLKIKKPKSVHSFLLSFVAYTLHRDPKEISLFEEVLHIVWMN